MLSRIFKVTRHVSQPSVELSRLSASVRFFNSNPFSFGPPFFDPEDNLIYHFAQKYPRLFLVSASVTTITLIYALSSNKGEEKIADPEKQDQGQVCTYRSLS